MTTQYINIQDYAVQELMQQDPTLAKLIQHIGNIEIHLRPDPLKSLIRSIIGQQITVKAAAAIFQRFSIAIHDIWSVQVISNLSETEMRNLGLSKSKMSYVQNLLSHVKQNKLDFTALSRLNDSDAKHALTEIKGIGQWTAEVFLMFTLQRQNVLPIYDVGLQKAAQWLYQTSTLERKKQLKLCRERWSPYASIGAFYLWKAIHQNLLSYDSIDSLTNE